MQIVKKNILIAFFANFLVLFANAQTNHYYISHVKSDSNLVIRTNLGFLKIQPFSENILQMAFSPEGKFNKSSDAILPLKFPNTLKFDENNGSFVFTTDQFKLIIKKHPIGLTFYNLNGDTILSEITGGFSNKTGNGFRFLLSRNEMITGGGVRALPLNRRGYILKLNNEPHWGYGYGEVNLNYSVPVFLSSRNYMLFYDAPQRAVADIGKTNTNYFDLYSGNITNSCFIIVGDNFKELIKNYTKLTGTQPLPPRWAFGNLQSRFGYKSQTETIQKTDSIINAGYPLDAMIIDLYWFGKGMGDFRMGDLWWEPENWPNPEQMINDLKCKGVKTILITEPYILTNSKNYGMADSLEIFGKDSLGKTFVIKDFWFGPAGIIDVFNPKAINWFWDKYKILKEQGVEGWWGDLGEPEKHPSGIFYSKGSSDEIHNIYGHYWSKMLADKYTQEFPNDRLFFLNRAGYAGSQRYSVFPWSGDVSRSWSGFRAQLPIMLGMSLNGIPYMHSDLGGFAAGIKDEELYTRWLQFGVFNPIFRPHGESIPSEPIYFSDSTQLVVRKYIKLRYRMMPYNYTLAWRQAVFGEPLARPLSYVHPEMNEMFNNDSTYYWGNNILVSPILMKQQKERTLYLPGGFWFDMFSNRLFEGNKWITVPVSINNIPVFIKAGSFIPMVPDFYPNDTLSIRYYYHNSVNSSKYELFEDDGKERLSIEKNHYQLTKFIEQNEKDRITFQITGNDGDYSTKPLKQTIIFSIYNFPNKPKIILVNGSKSKWVYNERDKILSFGFIRTERMKINIKY